MFLRNIFNYLRFCLLMVFEKGARLYAVEVESKEGENVMYVNYMQAGFVPSIAEQGEVMGMTIDALAENPDAARVIFVQQRNYNYPFEQVSLLAEIARLYNFLVKQEEILSPSKLSIFGNIAEAHGDLAYLLNLLKKDPIGCYLELRNRVRELRGQLDAGRAMNKSGLINYVRFLERFQGLLESTKLIKNIIGVVDEYIFGDREIYKDIFRPDVLPNFSFTRLMARLPKDADLVDQYELNDEDEKIEVTILKKENESKYFYHVMPPEYALSEEHHVLINLAKNVLIEHRPKAEEFTDQERTRQVFFNVSRDLLYELSKSKGIGLTNREANRLAKILVRHTIGFGLIEILLQDKKLQDIVLNAPIAQNPVFLRHADYDECVTNIIPSYEDADSWAAKLRLQSGRPLDEANPVLDSDLVFTNVRARVAAITKPLSPYGLAYAFRRHRDEPWTLPLFIKNKMINSFTAGLFSFLISGGRTLLVAGTRSSGKTSVLGALMLEIMSKTRIIVVEDSVTGDSKIVVKENGKFGKTTIGELIDERIKRNGFVDVDGREKELNSSSIEIFSVNKDGKVVLSKPSKFIRHKVNKQIYEIVTTSGKRIKVTEDHSLFTLDERSILRAMKTKDLGVGDFIAIPFKLPFDNFFDSIDLLDHTDKLRELNLKIFILGKGVEKFISECMRELFTLAYSLGYKKSRIQNWIAKKILPLDIFERIKDKIDKESLFLKTYGASKMTPSKISLDEELLNFVGLWLADGCYDKRSIIVSVEEEGNRKLVQRIAQRFNCKAKVHSDGFSLQINLTLFKHIMERILELYGNSYTKQIPSWVYNLSDRQVGWLLRGFFSGDGCVSDKEIIFSVCSRGLIDDIATLLLRFNIVLRISTSSSEKISQYGKDSTILCRIGATKMIQRFKDNIGFLIDSKQKKLEKLCARISTHDATDVIPLSLNVKKELQEILNKMSAQHYYAKRNSNVGREHLAKLLTSIPVGITNPIDPLRKIVTSDIFWDKVKSINKVNYEGYVYDISVPSHENFICENIIAHNTMELSVDAMRKIGYDILRMKVRSALVSGTTEVEASEGIRTSLRLGDSALIVGEVRSDEAKALYEAMRVGALANVVAGTIHGDSPYGVFDRVVNDLNVPATSFKASDIIIVANPVRTADGLHSQRRIVSVTEVRKHWSKDPALEGGFVELLKYNVERDELEPTQELVNGESEVIKSIASSVKGWVGNWDAVYDNIILRGKVKQEIVNAAEKLNKPELLEAGFNSLANGAFYEISDEVRGKFGLPIGDRVFEKWKKWLYKEAERI